MSENELKLPNILVIGAMKCATSSICNFLERHPDIYFLPHEEPNFFSNDDNWAQGLEAYRQRFAAGEGYERIGEGSNSYTNVQLYPDAVARIRATIPDVRLIYSVRHPVDRIASAWAQLRFQSPDQISHDINRAVREQPDRLLGPSFYWRQASAYLEHFSKDRLWVGFLEDLKADERAFYASLCAFCGIGFTDDLLAEDSWKNKTGEHNILGAEYTAIKSAPGVEMVKKLLPKELISAVKKRMEKKTPTTKELLAILDLPDAVRRDLKEDARAFLQFAGKPEDFWTI